VGHLTKRAYGLVSVINGGVVNDANGVVGALSGSTGVVTVDGANSASRVSPMSRAAR
jgi:hypothetical protein